MAISMISATNSPCSWTWVYFVSIDCDVRCDEIDKGTISPFMLHSRLVSSAAKRTVWLIVKDTFDVFVLLWKHESKYGPTKNEELGPWMLSGGDGEYMAEFWKRGEVHCQPKAAEVIWQPSQFVVGDAFIGSTCDVWHLTFLECLSAWVPKNAVGDSHCITLLVRAFWGNSNVSSCVDSGIVSSLAMIRCVLMLFFNWHLWCHPRVRSWGLTMAALPKHHLFSDLCGFALLALVLLCLLLVCKVFSSVCIVLQLQCACKGLRIGCASTICNCDKVRESVFKGWQVRFCIASIENNWTMSKSSERAHNILRDVWQREFSLVRWAMFKSNHLMMIWGMQIGMMGLCWVRCEFLAKRQIWMYSFSELGKTKTARTLDPTSSSTHQELRED